MNLIEYIENKPIKHIILDFGGTLLKHYSTASGNEVHEVLRAFVLENSENYTFYIWSHSPHDQIVKCLQDWNLESKIKTIISLDNMIEAKPSPASFALIADRDAINLQEWLLIGDTASDEQTAQALGIYFFKWI